MASVTMSSSDVYVGALHDAARTGMVGTINMLLPYVRELDVYVELGWPQCSSNTFTEWSL